MMKTINHNKVKIEYMVIILNYNTMDDAILAAESVNRYSLCDDYIICIADNGSNKLEQLIKLDGLELTHLEKLFIPTNEGYARGNNQAISFMLGKYEPKYICIMNPDVCLIEKGTIDFLISEIDKKGQNIVGGQPLVWNYHYGDDASVQINIRRVPNYFQLCLISFFPLRILFNKKYKEFIYREYMPYKEQIEYSVPSGAFFLIKKDAFEEINFFDPNTFLYYEEFIIGKRLEERGWKLLLVPQYRVKHVHGKSTKRNKYSVNKMTSIASIQAKKYYAKQYLRVGKVKLIILTMLSHLDYVLRMILSKVKSGFG